MARHIRLYTHEGQFLQWITFERLERLEGFHRVRVVRHRKGHVSRAILIRMPGEARPMMLGDYQGTRYSFRQQLGDGHVCWRLRSLGDERSDVNLAPDVVRPVFLRVLLDCLAPAAV